MATLQKVSNDGLGWVKKGLDEILEEARLGLEAFIEDASDKGLLIDAARNLFQAHGTLQMVELHGAALLAEEINAVIQAIIDEAVVRQDDALEVLSRAMLSLPDYLEHIQAGNRDIPTVLLPLLNDLRTSRNASLLSGEVLFNVDLESVTVPGAGVDPTNKELDLQQLAKKLRNSYQLGLLHTIRGDDIRQGFVQMATVLARFGAESRYEAARRLWWISEALAEAISQDGLEVSVTVKSLFGQIDRQIRSVITNGEKLFSDSIPQALQKNILYYLAIAENTGGLVEQVKQAWSLDEVIPKEAQLDEVREQLAGPNLEVLKTVSEAVREELAEVKDQLELFIHADKRGPEQLDGLEDRLLSIASTLTMLGLESSQNAVFEQAKIVAQVHAGEIEASETVILDMAKVMLDIESAIDGIIDSRASVASIRSAQEFDEIGDDAVASTQFTKISNVVVVEAQRDMAGIKETLVEFVADPARFESLVEVPESLERIRGALSIMRIESMTPVLDSMLQFIRHDLIEGQQEAQAEELEALADAVTSVEFFLESLQNPAGNRDRILDLGYESVARLGYSVPEPDVSELDMETIEQEEFAAIEHELVSADDNDVQPVQISSRHATHQVDITPIDFPENSRPPAPNLEPTEQDNAVSQDAEKKNSIDLAIIDPEIDEEILEVFVEEAEEQTEAIRDQLAVWRADANDSEALATLRRGFHTLKGSGRLIGAEIMGEFAWAFEDMLNRVIEGRVERSEPLFQALENSANCLPELIAQITDGASPTTDIASLMDAAQALSKGELPEIGAGQTDSQAVNEDVSISEPAEEPEQETPESGGYIEIETPAQASELEALSAQIEGVPVTQPEDESKPVSLEGNDSGEIELLSEDDEPGAQSSQGAEEQQAVDQPEVEPIAIESELLQIYLTEAEQHTGILEEMLAQNEPLVPGDDFIRSLHTLKGASLTARVTDISSLCAPLEAYARKLQGAKAVLSEEARGIYVSTTEALREILGALRSGQQPATDTRQLQQDIDTLLAGSDDLVIPLLPDEDISAWEDEALDFDSSTIPEEQGIDALEADIFNVDEQFSGESDANALDDVQDTSELTEAGEEPDPVLSEQPEDQDAGIEVTEMPAAEDWQPETASEEVADDVEQTATATAVEAMDPGVPDIPGEQDADLVEIFMEEAEDILMACDNSLALWRDGNDAAEQISELKRQLHTIKGGARMSGFTNIGDLSHAMETAIMRFADSKKHDSKDALLKSLQQSIDRLHIMLEQVRQSEPVYPASDLVAYFEAFPDSADAVKAQPVVTGKSAAADGEKPGDTLPEEEVAFKSESEDKPVEVSQAESNTTQTEPARSRSTIIEEIPALDQEKIQKAFESARHAAQDSPPPPPAAVSKPAASQEMIRVQADLLDSLVNNAGEVNIYQSRFTQQTHSYGYNLMELEQTVMRLREQLRKMEIETEAQILFRHERDTDTRHADFDPLEMDRYSTLQHLSRSLGESVNDLVSIKDILLELLRDSETLLSQQSRVSTELQEGLMRTRMVQFSGVIPRLRRIVRQTSDELAKQVELEVIGEQNEVDRSVLNRMVAPLEHLLRNAISHGIEEPEVREKAGKKRTGKIRISITREGAEVVMRVSDDGAGINREAVLEKARKQKMIGKRQKLTDNDILGLILEPGFSTAASVTQIAGRGVGMDVVDSEIKQLGGVLNIESEQGVGTRFIIRLPFTLAITQALLVQSGEEMYCLPLASIEGVVRLSVEELAEKYQQTTPVYQYANQAYELMHLGDLMGHSKPVLGGPEGMFPVLLVRSGDNRIALQIEALHGNREIVLKPVGKQLSKVRGISGATILGDGRVVLVLDVTGLVRLGAGIHIFGSGQDELVETQKRKTSTVMVVDDSITIRKITSRLLERNHYAVMTAKDGVDAVAVLQEQIPDLILLDIEMPRMDGFELAMHIRNNERLKHIPIIMITSRTGDKHKNRALDIGVNGYLGKPYKEPELLEHVRAILQPETEAEEA